MYSKFLMLSMAIVGSFASPSEVVDTDTKASSPLINCGCQCSPLTFRDAKGEVQGNCRTVDGTGAQWCYVDSAHSSCQDLVPSQRFPNNPWSYEACATPSIGSPLCPVAPASVVVPAVPVAPAAPVAPQHPTYPLPAAPTDHHPVAPHQPEVIIGQGPGFGVAPNGNYDPESIGDIRLGDASSKINLPPTK
eukprot:TRINITY_DN6834_c0_g1_i2.p1 TRINITY_DN6834_c0_g1~~TRINITY_DN6834_c0_g1_i2.p1  ORF type:complete len:191 (+),score=33.57 TRINITY_DN6834_c0_g1_i2:46-618(+)